MLAAGTANDTWYATCGVGAAGEGVSGICTMKNVVERAWCLGQYQMIGTA